MKNPTADEQKRANDIIDEWNSIQTQLGNWRILWDDCARYILPRKGNILTKLAPGAPQTINLYDSTAKKALGIYAAGVMTHIIPAGEKWFRFQPKRRKGVPISKPFEEWLDEVTDIVLDLLISSNFYLAIHEDIIEGGLFGTSALLEEESKTKLINFTNIPVGSFGCLQNDEGMIDTTVREYKWTARQAAQKFGRENLGPVQSQALAAPTKESINRKFTYLHRIAPRPDSGYEGGPVAGQNRPWASTYVCVEDKQIMQDTGYYTQPLFVSRTEVSNNEVYGRGPGLDIMPEVKLVNAMERDILTWTELMGNPPWIAPDDASLLIDGRPGGITYYDATNLNGKPEQVVLKNRVDLAEQKTEQKREAIRSAFFNDMFQLLTNLEEQRREKTAYEVQQMVAEKLLLFNPLFTRFVTEKINPLLERTLDIAARAGVLPPVPVDVPAGAEYEINYTSKIALAIKSAENQAFATMITLVQEAAPLDPSIPYLFKWRDGLRNVGRNVGMPASLFNTDKVVDEQFRAAMAAQQAQQAAQTADLATKAAKNLGPQAQQAATRRIISAAGAPA